MAPDDEEDARRKRRREREDEIEQEEREKKRKMGVELVMPPQEKIEEMLARVEPLLAQVDSLYNQYLHGQEKNPPLERRKQLENLMATLMLVPKSNTDLNFRFGTLHARFVSTRDKWDRTIRDLETGKIKRGTRSR